MEKKERVDEKKYLVNVKEAEVVFGNKVGFLVHYFYC